ncbi:hypothetical protein LR48_Vigan10g062600 [Vigna angularis]|uniref:Uncharacterized protein n=1 Tax=Phaseolus angularis TaxID=3914 RepID=A0A0L9VJ21_PHAAN|nr:hypothetical protein LR48_Vigan10g062600 [Vigna angularis]
MVVGGAWRKTRDLAMYQDLLERRWKLATLMVIAEHSGLGLKINVGVISWFSIAGLGCCKGGAAWSRLGFPLRFLAWWKVVQEDEPVVTAKVKTNRVGGGVDGVLTATSRLRCRGKGTVAHQMSVDLLQIANEGIEEYSPTRRG